MTDADQRPMPAGADRPGTDGVLDATGIVMSFSGNRALDGVDLHVGRGEWLGLIGPNGSGKTTLINVLSGIYVPQSGTVRVDGAVVPGSPRHRAAAGIVRSFQQPQLADSLTLLENVQLALDGSALRRGERWSRAAERARCLEALAHFGCERYAHQLPAHVPYGVRKLTELARASVARPRILLLDEPAAGLSREERVELVVALNRLRDAEPALAVCLIEHDVPLVAKACTRLQVLDFGRAIATGDVASVLRDEAVRTAYLGRSHSGTAEEAR